MRLRSRKAMQTHVVSSQRIACASTSLGVPIAHSALASIESEARCIAGFRSRPRPFRIISRHSSSPGAPGRGHQRRAPPCLLWASSRLMQCSKQHHCSITSSARPSSGSGIVRPSVLAEAPLNVVCSHATTLWHFDAAEWASSTASKAAVQSGVARRPVYPRTSDISDRSGISHRCDKRRLELYHACSR